MISSRRFWIVPFIFLGLFTQNLLSQKKDLALKYFMQEENYEGVVLLYDYNEDQLYTSHMNKAGERVLPASTFKIFNTLMLLKFGVAKDTTYTLPWNGREYKHKGRKVPSWYKDTNLAEAFRNSTVWYYKALSNPIDFKTYKEFMKKHKYGKVFGRDKDGIDFWNVGAKIGISAKDQIKFLARLHENNTLFSKEHMAIVKELMVEKKTDNYVLRSKTGWTETPESRFKKPIDLGWYIGYIEQEDNAYFFAVRLEKPADERRKSFASDRKKIAFKAIEHQFGIKLQ